MDEWLLTWNWHGNVYWNTESFIHWNAICSGNWVSLINEWSIKLQERNPKSDASEGHIIPCLCFVHSIQLYKNQLQTMCITQLILHLTVKSVSKIKIFNMYVMPHIFQRRMCLIFSWIELQLKDYAWCIDRKSGGNQMHLDVIVFKRNLALCLLFATLLTSDENNVNYVLTSMRVCVRRDHRCLMSVKQFQWRLKI